MKINFFSSVLFCFIITKAVLFLGPAALEAVVLTHNPSEMKSSLNAKEIIEIIQPILFDFSSFAGRENQMAFDELMQKRSSFLPSLFAFGAQEGKKIMFTCDVRNPECQSAWMDSSDYHAACLHYINILFDLINEDNRVKAQIAHERSLKEKKFDNTLAAMSAQVSLLEQELKLSASRICILGNAAYLVALFTRGIANDLGEYFYDTIFLGDSDEFFKRLEQEEQAVLINELLERFKYSGSWLFDDAAARWAFSEVQEFLLLMRFIEEEYIQHNELLNKADQDVVRLLFLLDDQSSSNQLNSEERVLITLMLEKSIQDFETLLIKQRQIELSLNYCALAVCVACQQPWHERNYQALAFNVLEANKGQPYYSLAIRGLKVIGDVKCIILNKMYEQAHTSLNEGIKKIEEFRKNNYQFEASDIDKEAESKNLLAFIANRKGIAFLAELFAKSLMQISHSASSQVNEIMDVQSMLIYGLYKKNLSH